jgi:hypothetical protein
MKTLSICLRFKNPKQGLEFQQQQREGTLEINGQLFLM